MIIYHYHRGTKEFTSKSQAKVDPLESELQGKDVFLIPGFCTKIEAPIITEVNKVARFTDDAWEVVDDFRGTKYWNKNAKEFVINRINFSVPVGMITIAPPNDMREPKWEDGAWVEKYVEPEPHQHIEEAEIEALRNATTVEEIVEFILLLIRR